MDSDKVFANTEVQGHSVLLGLQSREAGAYWISAGLTTGQGAWKQSSPGEPLPGTPVSTLRSAEG